MNEIALSSNTLTRKNADEMASLAMELMAARLAIRARKSDYREIRDRFLKDDGRDMKWRLWLEDEKFRAATDEAYLALKKAKQHQHNVIRRMETRYRKITAREVS